jgi:hypothetical protein
MANYQLGLQFDSFVQTGYGITQPYMSLRSAGNIDLDVLGSDIFIPINGNAYYQSIFNGVMSDGLRMSDVKLISTNSGYSVVSHTNYPIGSFQLDSTLPQGLAIPAVLEKSALPWSHSIAAKSSGGAGIWHAYIDEVYPSITPGIYFVSYGVGGGQNHSPQILDTGINLNGLKTSEIVIQKIVETPTGLAILFAHRIAGTANYQLELSSFIISSSGAPSLVGTVSVGGLTDWYGRGDLLLSKSGNLEVLVTGPLFTYSTNPATLKIYSYDSGLNPWGSSGNVTNIPISTPSVYLLGISFAETTLNHFVASWSGGNYVVSTANIDLAYSGASTTIQTNLNSGQRYSYTDSTKVLAFADGGYVLAWRSNPSDAPGVYMKSFNSSGVAISELARLSPANGADIIDYSLLKYGENGFLVVSSTGSSSANQNNYLTKYLNYRQLNQSVTSSLGSDVDPYIGSVSDGLNNVYIVESGDLVRVNVSLMPNPINVISMENLTTFVPEGWRSLEASILTDGRLRVEGTPTQYKIVDNSNTTNLIQFYNGGFLSGGSQVIFTAAELFAGKVYLRGLSAGIDSFKIRTVLRSVDQSIKICWASSSKWNAGSLVNSVAGAAPASSGSKTDR